MEPERGKYNFTLVYGVIAQARREGVRLILLWFGLWKNGSSSYAPVWVKTNPDYFYMCGMDGGMVESVSPFCGRRWRRIRRGHPRDCGKAADRLFDAEIPQEMAEFL